MDTRTYPASFAAAILDAASSKGADREEILRAVGLSEEILLAERGRVTAKTLNIINQRVIETLDDENHGFMRDPIKPGTFAMMCYACVGASTLRVAVHRECRFYSLITDNFSVHLEEKDGLAYFSLKTLNDYHDPKNYMVPSLLGISYRWMSWMVGQKIVLDHASFASPRPDIASDYNFLFSCPVKFNGSENYICFSANYLEKRITQNEETLKQFLSDGSSGLLAQPRDDDTLPARVQSLIREHVGEEFPEIDDIAAQLHMTPITLRRKLKREGSSYQQIKDDVRRDTAIYMLSRGGKSIEDIAEEVGFSEPTSFFRAFKRWTGVTPRSYLKSSD